MFNRFFLYAAALLYGLSACKSSACECADVYIKAAKETKNTKDPIKKIKILGKQEYLTVIQKCDSLVKLMSAKEKMAFEEEIEQCPSVREYKSNMSDSPK